MNIYRLRELMAEAGLSTLQRQTMLFRLQNEEYEERIRILTSVATNQREGNPYARLMALIIREKLKG